MVDDKRFTLAYEKGNWWAVRDYDITLWKEEVVDRLNEQYQRIRELERENKCLKESMKLTHPKKLENMSNEEFWNIIKNMRGES